MKTKTLVIAVGILIVLAGIASWVVNREGSSRAPAERLAGEELLSPEILQAAREIHLIGASGPKVVLREKDGAWTLPEYFGLPADFDKLSRFTRTLLDAKIDRYVTSAPQRLERLELGRNTIRILGENAVEWALETGNSDPAGGTFIRFGDDESAYLTTASLSVDTGNRNWPVKRPLAFEEREVARVKLTVEGEELSFVRDEPGGSFAGENLAENEKVKSGEISRIVRGLANTRFTEAVAPDDDDAATARAHASPVVLELFDGASYTLNVGRRPGSDEESAGGKESAQKTDTSASIAIDQDGNIISPEAIAEAAGANAEPAEKVEPGPVFIFYEADAPDFVWSRLSETVALRFPDSVFNHLPASRDNVIEATAPEEEPLSPAETPAGEGEDPSVEN